MRKRGLTPQGWYESKIAGRVHYQSGYERKFMSYLDEKGFNWVKCRERFPYTGVDGKVHKYNPDFYLPDFKLYVEVKGMVRMNDPLKFAGCPEDRELVLRGCTERKALGLDVLDPTKSKKKLKPGQWPYNLLQKMPDFSKVGELSEELKRRLTRKLDVFKPL